MYLSSTFNVFCSIPVCFSIAFNYTLSFFAYFVYVYIFFKNLVHFSSIHHNQITEGQLILQVDLASCNVDIVLSLKNTIYLHALFLHLYKIYIYKYIALVAIHISISLAYI